MASWQWFHRMGSPKWFYEKMRIWMLALGFLSCAMIMVGMVWGLAFAPAELKQGNSYRIMYVHVPTAIVSMGGYYVMAIAGAIGLIWRMKLSFMVMKSTAPVGAILTFLGLFTGAVWGKPTWGVYWVWDARITFMVILFFIYLGIIALQEAYPDKDMGDKAAALLSLVGMVVVPLIYKSVDWWFTLHQKSTFKLTEKSTIDPSMAYPLILMIFATYMFFAWMVIYRTRVEILYRERKTQWVKQALLGPA